MTSLPEDSVFIARMVDAVRAAGVMRAPVFDPTTCQLVEDELRIDLLNVWHETRQLTDARTPETIEACVRPKTLRQAAYFGRVDVVRRFIDARDLEGGADGLDGAIGAYVVTSSHVAIVELLLAAGVPPSEQHFATLSAESVGSANDARIGELLRKYAAS